MNGAALFESRAAAPFLALPSAAWGAVTALRNALYDAGRLRAHRLPCAVVSVGNLTVGGTGKTPLVSWLAARLRDAGWRTGVVSRGYGRQDTEDTLLVSDGKALLSDAAHAGDEPYLIARDNPAVPVAVGADRVGAARRLLAGAPLEVILLDDGFQHRRIARDVDLVLVDGRDPWGNGRLLPGGPLRESVAALARADACIVTRSDGRVPEALAKALARHAKDLPVYHGRMQPRGFSGMDGESLAPGAFKGFTACVFSGIARPERFEDDLRALGVQVAATRRFPDHHNYRPADLEAVARDARAARADVVLTTEKDMVRLLPLPEGTPRLYALAIQPVFPDGAAPDRLLLDRLAGLRPRVAP